MNRFGAVVVDPPWEYAGGFNGWGKRKELPYRSMTLEEIEHLPIGSVVRREGYVFLWTTNKYLEASFRVARRWGLTPRQTVTWCKPPQRGLGGMFATTTEFIVVAQRIREGTNAHGSRTARLREPSSWFTWPKLGHSEKPPEFYDLVSQLTPGPFLDVFARREREGWTCIGDGIDGRDVRAALAELTGELALGGAR